MTLSPKLTQEQTQLTKPTVKIDTYHFAWVLFLTILPGWNHYVQRENPALARLVVCVQQETLQEPAGLVVTILLVLQSTRPSTTVIASCTSVSHTQDIYSPALVSPSTTSCWHIPPAPMKCRRVCSTPPIICSQSCIPNRRETYTSKSASQSGH